MDPSTHPLVATFTVKRELLHWIVQVTKNNIAVPVTDGLPTIMEYYTENTT